MNTKHILILGRVAEAEEILKQGAACNKIILPDSFKLNSFAQEKEKIRNKSFLDLFRNRNMRAKTVILFYNW